MEGYSLVPATSEGSRPASVMALAVAGPKAPTFRLPSLTLGKALVRYSTPVGVEKMSIDRKSTRLNSSHANISYAVFCLKKKNNTTDEITKLCRRLRTTLGYSTTGLLPTRTRDELTLTQETHIFLNDGVIRRGHLLQLTH